MPHFLSIQFPESEFPALAARGMKVVLAKTPPAGINPAWIAFSPFANNAVSWTEAYEIYANTTTVNEPMREIYLPMHPMPAQKGRKYTYGEGGGLHERPGEVPDAITVKNRVEPAADLAVKLLQPIWVNGEDHPSRPVMTAVLPAGQDLVWLVEPVVYIWLEWENGETTLPHRIGYSEGQTAGMVTYNGNGQWETSLRS